MLLYLALVVALAIFLGLEGLEEHHWPIAYSRHEVRNAFWMHVIYMLGAAISAGLLTTIMLESHSCFLKTTLCNLNIELRTRLGLQGDLTATDERGLPPVKDMARRNNVNSTYGFTGVTTGSV
jgi:hypothetical protein